VAAVNYKVGKAKFSTYAFTVIRNHLLDLRKKRNLQIINVDWQQVESNDDELIKFSKFLARDEGRFERLERRESKNEFLARLNPLLTPEERRITILLARGKSQTEIGYLLKMSQATVNRRIQVLRKKIREMGADDGYA
jgi:RNA polymerase sigma factor (sigma-70 family)